MAVDRIHKVQNDLEQILMGRQRRRQRSIRNTAEIQPNQMYNRRWKLGVGQSVETTVVLDFVKSLVHVQQDRFRGQMLVNGVGKMTQTSLRVVDNSRRNPNCSRRTRTRFINTFETTEMWRGSSLGPSNSTGVENS